MRICVYNFIPPSGTRTAFIYLVECVTLMLKLEQASMILDRELHTFRLYFFTGRERAVLRTPQRNVRTSLGASFQNVTGSVSYSSNRRVLSS